jgi:hypothetical protein
MARKLTKRQSSTARTSTKIYYAASIDEIHMDPIDEIAGRQSW